jgi:hypothetical protein
MRRCLPVERKGVAAVTTHLGLFLRGLQRRLWLVSFLSFSMFNDAGDRRHLTCKRLLWDIIIALVCAITVTHHKVITWDSVVLRCRSGDLTWFQRSTVGHWIGYAQADRHYSSEAAASIHKDEWQCDSSSVGSALCKLPLHERLLLTWRHPWTVVAAFEGNVEAHHLQRLEHPSWFVGIPVLNLLWALMAYVLVMFRKVLLVRRHTRHASVASSAAATASSSGRLDGAPATPGILNTASTSTPKPMVCEPVITSQLALVLYWVKAAFIPMWLCSYIISALCHPMPSSLLHMTFMYRVSASCHRNWSAAVALFHILCLVSCSMLSH